MRSAHLFVFILATCLFCQSGLGQAPSPAPDRIHVSEEVQVSKLIARRQPYNPPGLQGTVVLYAIIGKDGGVSELQVISGPQFLVGSALTAVRQWRYSPTLVNGTPVEVETTITVPFLLQMPSVTMDLSKGASFKFNIAADLPPFSFNLIPEIREPDRGDARSTVRDIEVFRGDSDQPYQHLTGCNLSDMEPPPRAETDPPWFRAEDVNFDGYQDVFLLTNWGATGSQSGCLWLYNRAAGRFDYSKEFSELGRHWLDPQSKTILTFGNGGMAGTIYDARKYEVENDRPVLIYLESQDWEPDKNDLHCVVQELRGSDMATIRDERGEKPCDPADVMRPFLRPPTPSPTITR